MDLVKSWAVAVLVFVLGSALTVYVATAAKTTEAELASTSGAIVWNIMPAFLIYFFMAALSAVAHSEPQRENPLRHALAVLAIPGVLIVLTLAFGLLGGASLIGVGAGLIGSVVGAFAGFVLIRRLRSRSRTPASKPTGDGYF